MNRYAFGLASVAVLAGCSSSPMGTPSGETSGDAGSTASDAAGVTASDAGPSGETMLADGGLQAYASIGPIDVPAGVEKTVCIIKNLGNADDLVVSSISASLAAGSHHMIVYKSTETQENLTPTPCAPFTGLLTGTEPIVIVNRLNLTFDFPAGVAFEIPPNQMLRIEAHYINATAADLQGQGTVTFQGTPKASAPAFQQADFLFWGTGAIDIPPQSTFTTGPVFQNGIAGTHMISITTHQHELGTGIQAWSSSTAGDMSDSIVDDTDWTNPSWRLLPSVIDFDGTNGLTFQCNWDNTTNQTVTFGESALDEMCFVGGFYYPSHGFDLCVDGYEACTGAGR